MVPGYWMMREEQPAVSLEFPSEKSKTSKGFTERAPERGSSLYISDSVSLKGFLGLPLFLPDNLGVEVDQRPQSVNEG